MAIRRKKSKEKEPAAATPEVAEESNPKKKASAKTASAAEKSRSKNAVEELQNVGADIVPSVPITTEGSEAPVEDRRSRLSERGQAGLPDLHRQVGVPPTQKTAKTEPAAIKEHRVDQVQPVVSEALLPARAPHLATEDIHHE